MQELGPNDFLFGVRLYTPNAQGTYQPVWINVPFDGTMYPTDLLSTDPNEYWPTLFQRAYLTLAQETGVSAENMGQAYEALTGQPYNSGSISSSDISLASTLSADLDAGEPVVAGTVSSGPLILDSSGIISDHAYTVLGIDSGPSGTYVTVRNPWAQDTDWTYYTNDPSVPLTLSQDAAMRQGLDGTNDGILRIPWSTFTSDFAAYIAGSNLFGPSLNTPESKTPPVFPEAGLGPQTVTEGDTLSLNVAAVSQDGGTITYSLSPNNDPYNGASPGSVNPTTGQYTWTPGQYGDYNVTVIAQESPVDSYSLTFQVDVLPKVADVGSFTAGSAAISAANPQITLTVSNVVATSQIGEVEIYRDTNHTGIFDPNTDQLLASLPYNSTGTYVFAASGSALSNLTPGVNETFFARAYLNANDTTYYGAPASLTVQVIAGESLPPLVAPAGVETLVNPSSDFQGHPLVAYDGSDNSAVFWTDQTTHQIYMQRFDSTGTAIGGATSLDLVQGTADDVAMLANGHFVILWTDLSDDLLTKEFNADGTAYDPDTYTYNVVDTSGTTLPSARIAISAVGEYSVVYADGPSFTATAYLARFSNGFSYATVPLDSGDDAGELAVAMDSSGATVAGWVDATTDQVMGQLFNADPRSPVGSPVVLNTGVGSVVVSDYGFALALDDTGHSVFVWAAYNGTTDVLMARRFLPDLTPVDPAEFQVNDSSSGNVSQPRIAFQANRFVITWMSTGASNQVFAQAYSWDNTLCALGGDFLVPTTTTGSQTDPVVAVDDSGTNFLVGWQSMAGPSDPGRHVHQALHESGRHAFGIRPPGAAAADQQPPHHSGESASRRTAGAIHRSLAGDLDLHPRLRPRRHRQCVVPDQ